MKKKEEVKEVPQETKEEITLNVTIDMSGGEKIVLPGLTPTHTQPIINWLKGNAHQMFEVVFAEEVYYINREFVATVKIEPVKG
jgi:hypothetical protein